MDTPDIRLARFAVGLDLADVPETVRRATKRAILNVLATLLAGAREPAVEKAFAVLGRRNAPGNAMLATRRERTDPLFAAFLNAMASNIHDFDDTHMGTILHPSSPVLPALLARASETPMSGAELLSAFIAGVEVECRIGRAISPSHYSRGWHITSTCGVFGSAAACGHHDGLSPDRMVAAFAIAGVQAGGMVEALGTMAKSVSVGNAARGGMVAAALAAEDFDGPPTPLTGERGFLALYADGPHAAPLTEGLGERWELADVAFKPYPVGVVLNPLIDAALDLRGRGVTRPEEIAAITLHGHPLLRERTDRPAVTSGRLSQVSAQHTLAITLIRGKAGLAEFDDAAATETLGRRPECRFVDDADRDPSSLRMEARLASGETVTIDIPAGRGSLANAMSDADIEQKFRACAGLSGMAGNADALIETVWSLETLGDAQRLAELCAQPEQA